MREEALLPQVVAEAARRIFPVRARAYKPAAVQFLLWVQVQVPADTPASAPAAVPGGVPDGKWAGPASVLAEAVVLSGERAYLPGAEVPVHVLVRVRAGG